MFNRLMPLVLACAMASFVPAATAQQQTAEGAQQFLSLLARDGNLNVSLGDRNGGLMAVSGTRTVTYRWLNGDAGGPYDDQVTAETRQLKWLLNIDKLEPMDARGNADPCTTRLETRTKEKLDNVTSEDGTFKKETFFGFDYPRYRKTTTEAFEDPAVKYAGPHYLTWSKAVISRAASGRITASAPGGKFTTQLVYPGDRTKDPEMTDRVEYAMKFLKASCDKTAATGF